MRTLLEFTNGLGSLSAGRALGLRMRSALACALLVFAATTAACSDNAELDWREDVRLPDGRIITLTRHQEFRGAYTIGDTPSVSDYWFEFTHPTSGQKIKWQSDRYLSTVALMMGNDEPFLLVTPNFSGVFKYDCPDPAYLLFHYRNGHWIRVPLEAVPVKRLRANMTINAKDHRDQIRRQGLKLSAQDTERTVGAFRGQYIDFGLMKQQTFERASCDRAQNYLRSKD